MGKAFHKPLYVAIAQSLSAYHNAEKAGNAEWSEKHIQKVLSYTDYLPNGSGFDTGTSIDLNKSTEEKLVFLVSYHHMNSDGFYTGWTDHTVTITPSLVSGFDIKVSGRNKNEIKDHIAECFINALEQVFDTLTGNPVSEE